MARTVGPKQKDRGRECCRNRLGKNRTVSSVYKHNAPCPPPANIIILAAFARPIALPDTSRAVIKLAMGDTNGRQCPQPRCTSALEWGAQTHPWPVVRNDRALAVINPMIDNVGRSQINNNQ